MRKRISFETEKTVVDELFSMNHSRFEMSGPSGFRKLVHRTSDTVLHEDPLAKDRSLISIVLK